MDARFFRKAKKAGRAIDYTDSEAIIPEVKGTPETRVALPNRRPRTIEERKEALEVRRGEITALEERIEGERKTLLNLVKSYQALQSGGSEVVVQNLKVKSLMEQRSALARPEVWIEEVEGMTLKDVFESKRDIRKLNSTLFQVKRRVEPLTSLYVDLGEAAAAAAVASELQDAATAQATMEAAAAAKAAKTAKEIQATAQLGTDAAAAATKATQGAIIAQRRSFKVKKTG